MAAASAPYDLFLKARRAILSRLPESLKKSGTRSLPSLETGLIPASEESQIEEIGKRLFRSLVRPEQARKLRRRAAANEVTRIWIELTDIETDSQPWEVICDPARGPESFLATLRLTPVIRSLETPSRRALRQVDGPVRILGVIASPKGRPTLKVEKEKAALGKALKEYQALGIIELDWISGPNTVAKLTSRLNQQEWHVIHFIGHGDFDVSQQMGVLAFENKTKGEHLINAAQMQPLLAGSGVRLVVLNACLGAYAGKSGLFAGIGARLAQTIPAVVAMQTAITDDSALEFSKVLYEQLTGGASIERAVMNARIHLRCLPSNGAIEWPAPVLYLSTTKDLLDLQTLKSVAKQDTRKARRRTDAARRSSPQGRRKTAPEDDPQKYQWGGKPVSDGRKLTGKVYRIQRGWYRVTMEVLSLEGPPKLQGSVKFHLHDSFPDQVRTVKAKNGKATLSVVAYGAFTVGVEADAGKTRLELDLSELPGAPAAFRNN
jgi:hypothetical protein